MTTTPTVWKPQHLLRPAELTDLVQTSLGIADIGGGQYVVVYSELTSLRGRVFDAEGNSIGDPFDVSSGGSSPSSPVIASNGTGLFVVAHTGETAPSATLIGATVFDADLDVVVGGPLASPASEIPASTDTVDLPAVAMRADGSFAIAYLRKDAGDGTYDVVAKRVNATNQVTSEILIYDSADTDPTSTEVAALSNGNYVIAYQKFFDASDSDPHFRLVNQDLGDIYDGQVDLSSSEKATDVQATALANGRFVVVWQTDDDRPDAAEDAGVKARVYFNNGAPASDVFTVNSTIAGNQITPDVAALKDGGFVVVWKNVPTGTFIGQRFDSDGDKIGSEFLAGSSSAFTAADPVVSVLGDGRFIVGFETAASFDVFGTIFDPREKTINGTNGVDVLTSRIDGATVNGLGGIDTLLGQGSADRLDGGSSADLMKGRGGSDTYVVDNAGDVADETGGSGTDLVLSSRTFSLSDGAHAKGTIENLTLTGTAASGTGNGSISKIFGNGSANQLFGLGSNDTLDGAGGNDRVNGGVGLDTLTGGGGPDTFVFDTAVNSKAIAAANADIIADFNPKDDTIELLASMFPKLKVGVLKNKAFDSGKKKPAKDKHLVYYDEKNGGLWYDQNGKKQGGKGDVLIATLDPGLDLTAGDIVVA